MLYVTKKGEWMHDEDAAKKSFTDAYTKGASFLGACADIFLGLFDDKYAAPKSAGDDEGQSKMPDGPPQDERPVNDGPEKQPGARKTTTPSGW